MRAYLPLFLVLLACGDGGPPPAVEPPVSGDTFTHRFPAVSLGAAEEQFGDCQSWTLGNEAPLYVTRVSERNGGAWHHSNWVHTRDTYFEGEDGTWPCEMRGWSEAAAGVLGGGFFTQSTQSDEDVQAFPPGAAIELPALARITGGIHLLNTTPSPRDTWIEFTVDSIPQAEVTTILHGMTFTNTHLDIDARAVSEQVMECDLMEVHMRNLARPPDFRIFHVIPHYHALGVEFRLELVGGTRDGEVVFETTTRVGDPLGAPLDPPLDVTGATGLRMTCVYDNPSDAAVAYGIGDQEMCVFLAYTDSPLQIGGYTTAGTSLGDVGGRIRHETTCNPVGAPPL